MRRDPQLDFDSTLLESPLKTEIVSGWDLLPRLEALRAAGTPAHTLSTVSGYNALWQIQWFEQNERAQVKA